MKILIKTLSESLGQQLIDCWHAYRQHLNQYDSDVTYFFKNASDRIVPGEQYDVKILYDYMANNITESMIKNYDMVLICNGCEPISVANPKIKNLLKYDNVYLISNSYLSGHEIENKVVWFPPNFTMCRDYWTRHFYPQFYDAVEFEKLPRTKTLAVMTGANRSNRAYFFNLLQQAIPSLINHSTLNQQIQKLLDAQWETDEDQQYREYVNRLCRDDKRYTNSRGKALDNYYDQSVYIGIDNKFGSIPPGYFLLPLYYEYYCVVFPESSWQNNDLAVTEKSIKCFYAGSLPFPVGGANINRMYNELGFYTAWNLLPNELQQYDSILDHVQRAQACVTAIEWLSNNPMVFKTKQFTEYTHQNKINFLTCRADALAVKRFDKLVTSYVE